MPQSQFWRLQSPESTVKRADWAKDEVELEGVVCPINDDHQRAGKRLSDLSITLPTRAARDDLVWTWGSELLLRDRVLELFNANGFTGFRAKPVKVKFKRPDGDPPRLWELNVTGWGGMAGAESGIKLVEECSACGLLRYSACENPGKLIDTSNWDGSDFFMVWPLPKFIFVTDRVARLIRDSRLTGAVLQRTVDLHFSGGGFGGGRLSYWMPAERAHELGAALGIE
jgi:hypothetical protein